jgi:hypothetical protein
MGTNYYLHKENDTCPTCGHKEAPLHIGKSSAGWCFALAVYPDDGIRDLPNWIERWSAEGVLIRDEYGQDVTPAEMLEVVTERSCSVPWSTEGLIRNSAVRGPNNLARHRIDGTCLSHGAGTWDCLTAGFC